MIEDHKYFKSTWISLLGKKYMIKDYKDFQLNMIFITWIAIYGWTLTLHMIH